MQSLVECRSMNFIWIKGHEHVEQETSINGKLKLVRIQRCVCALALVKSVHSVLHICSVIKAVKHRNEMLNCELIRSINTPPATRKEKKKHSEPIAMGRELYCTIYGASRTISKSPIGFYYHNLVPSSMFVVAAFLHKILIIYWVSLRREFTWIDGHKRKIKYQTGRKPKTETYFVRGLSIWFLHLTVRADPGQCSLWWSSSTRPRLAVLTSLSAGRLRVIGEQHTNTQIKLKYANI